MTATSAGPWYKDITKDQWRALAAAKLGWMLDAMDFLLYVYAIGQLKAYFGFNDATAGLLGTVTGMIITFSQISLHGSGDPGELAYGIGQALVTTAAGLIVAIPVLVGHGYLYSMVDKQLGDIDKRREELMGNVVQAVANRRDEASSGRQSDQQDGREGRMDLRPGARPATQA